MPRGRRFLFRPEQRIRCRKEFEKVYRAKQRFETKWFIINYRANDSSSDRLGLSVSRRLGGSVWRSRAKRVLRELFRTNPWDRGPWADLVVAPKAALFDTGKQELRSCWRDAIGKIKARLRR